MPHRPYVFLGVSLLLIGAASSGCSETESSESAAVVQEQGQSLVALGAAGDDGQTKAPTASSSGFVPAPFVPAPVGMRAPFFEPHVSAPAVQQGAPQAVRVEAVIEQKAPIVSSPTQPKPVAPETIAKQNQYLQQWEQVRASIAALPLEEQEQRRADLKKAILGN